MMDEMRSKILLIDVMLVGLVVVGWKLDKKLRTEFDIFFQYLIEQSYDWLANYYWINKFKYVNNYTIE